MLERLLLPPLADLAGTTTIQGVFAREGDEIGPGAGVMDVRVEVGTVAGWDCAPVFTYRISLRERLWLRRVLVAPGDRVETGATLAILSDRSDTPLEDEEVRAARITVAGVIPETGWWDDAPA